MAVEGALRLRFEAIDRGINEGRGMRDDGNQLEVGDRKSEVRNRKSEAKIGFC